MNAALITQMAITAVESWGFGVPAADQHWVAQEDGYPMAYMAVQRGSGALVATSLVADPDLSDPARARALLFLARYVAGVASAERKPLVVMCGEEAAQVLERVGYIVERAVVATYIPGTPEPPRPEPPKRKRSSPAKKKRAKKGK